MENLGKKGRDMVTGLTGIISHFSISVGGVGAYTLAPDDPSDKGFHTYSKDRIEIIGDGITDKLTKAKKSSKSKPIFELLTLALFILMAYAVIDLNKKIERLENRMNTIEQIQKQQDSNSGRV